MVLFPTTPGLQKSTFASSLETFSHVKPRLDCEVFPKLSRTIISKEYEMISWLWWMTTLLKSWRVYIEVGLVMFNILVRSGPSRKLQRLRV